MAANKEDQGAIEAFGHGPYKAMPKSVAMMVLYQFAMRVADDFSLEGAFGAIRAEIEILAENGILSTTQAKRVLSGFQVEAA